MNNLAMRYTFVDADNTNGTALGVDNEDITVWKLIIGSPTSGEIIRLYNIQNPVNAATTNLAVEINLPTFSTTNINPGVYVIDFGPGGLRLNEGGAIQVDAAVAATVVWSATAS